MITLNAAVRLIGRKDALEIQRDRRLMTAVALTVALALLAVFTTFARAGQYDRDRSAASAMEQASWLGQGERDPHSAAHFSRWAFRPVTAPALLDPGTLPYAGSAIWMEAHARNPAAVRAAEDRSATLDLGEFSLAWVLQTLAPLVLLMLTAGVIARERERGTLRMLLSSGVSAKALVPSKADGLARVGVLILSPLIVAAVAAVWLAPGRIGLNDAARVTLWVATHVALLAIVLMIGVAVSARSRTTAAAMAALIGLWVLAVPVAPRAAATLAEAISPTPSGDRFWADITREIHDGFDGSGTAEERSARLKASLLAANRTADTDDLPISFRGANLDANERFGNQAFQRGWDRLYRLYDRQRDIMRLGSVLTPLIAAQNISAALASTDNLHARDFARQTEVERQRIVNGLNRDLTANGAGNAAYRADDRLWRNYGPTVTQPVSVLTALASIWIDLAILAAWVIGAVVFLRQSSHALTENVGA